jgi:hypothetical protein
MTTEGERNPSKREELYFRAKALNQKGKCVTTNTPDCPENGQMIESELGCEVESEDQVTDLSEEEREREDEVALFRSRVNNPISLPR